MILVTYPQIQHMNTCNVIMVPPNLTENQPHLILLTGYFITQNLFYYVGKWRFMGRVIKGTLLSLTDILHLKHELVWALSSSSLVREDRFLDF